MLSFLSKLIKTASWSSAFVTVPRTSASAGPHKGFDVHLMLSPKLTAFLNDVGCFRRGEQAMLVRFAGLLLAYYLLGCLMA